MNAITRSARPGAGLVTALLLAGCAAGANPTAVPATPTSLATPSVAIATPAPTPTVDPTATAPSPPPTPGVDAVSTAVAIHIEEPECVTAEAGTTTYVNDVRQLRGWGRHCRYDADPRFSGWSDIVHNADCYGDRCVMWGTERIPGPDGDWVGTYQGGSLGEVRGQMAVLQGTGAYEGWTFMRYMDMAALGGEEWVIDGLIYHGPPPPVPPLPSPASG
jgi:hypothetical protein